MSPVITHQLLHQISQISIRSEDPSFVSTSRQPSSSTSTPLDTSSSKQRGNEYIELDTIKPKTLASSSSEPSLPLSTGTIPKKRPPNLEHSFSLPTDIPPTSYQPYSFGEGTLSRAYLNKPTGRAQSQDLTETDTKPDFWKIAYYGIKFISKSKKVNITHCSVPIVFIQYSYCNVSLYIQCIIVFVILYHNPTQTVILI